MKKWIALLLCLTLTLTLLAGCGGSQPAAAESAGGQSSAAQGGKTVVIGTQEMPNSEGIAKSLGYFEKAFGDAGYQVSLVSFSSGAKVNAALLSGDIDFGLIGTCPVSNGLSSGIDYKVIWIHEILGSAESLAVKNDAGVDSVAQLKGKTIATPFASTAHYSLIKALEQAGLKETDVNLVDMQPAEIFAAWERGDIQAAYVWEPTLSKLLDSGKILLTSGDMAKAGYMTADLEVVRTEFANAHPDLVKIYLQCLDKAVKLYKDDQAAAEKAIADGLEITVEDARTQMSGYQWLSAQEQYDQYFQNGELAKTLASTASFLKDQGSIQSAPEQSVFDAAVDSADLKAYLGS